MYLLNVLLKSYYSLTINNQSRSHIYVRKQKLKYLKRNKESKTKIEEHRCPYTYNLSKYRGSNGYVTVFFFIMLFFNANWYVKCEVPLILYNQLIALLCECFAVVSCSFVSYSEVIVQLRGKIFLSLPLIITL